MTASGETSAPGIGSSWPLTAPGPLEERLRWAETIFDHDRDLHDWQHRSLDTIFASRPIRRGSHVSDLGQRAADLPERFSLPACRATYLGVPPVAIDRDQLLGLVGTRGLLVWHDGAIVHEEYLHGHRPSTRWMTNSASKLVVSMLVARAQSDGVLGPHDTPLTTYWPELAGTAWDGVTLGHCLSMTTGVDWHEESLDLKSEGCWPALIGELVAGRIDAYVPTVGRRGRPGTEVVYSSLDTEALGGTLIRAAHASIAELMQRWIWEPAGMQENAYWMCDPSGRELALSGLCATLRDYARLGVVLLNDGEWNGQRITPATFSHRLSQPDDELFHMPGHDDYPLVVWEQAFLPNNLEDQAGDYMAAGSYGQLIYVNPAARTVVAHQGIGADITTEYIDMYRLFMAFRQMSGDLAGTV